MNRHSIASHGRKAGLLALALALPLAGCGNLIDRVSEIGKEPSMDPIENPTQQVGYQPVSLPMPAPMQDIRQPASLWRQGSRAFFKDQRAGKVGDILTVVIEIQDQATLSNGTTQERDGSNSAGLDNLLGYEQLLSDLFPDGIDAGNLVNSDSESSTSGTGSVNRSEAIRLRVAAVITQVLPNGNMVLQGTQQVRVNYELRALTVGGVIRPEDINNVNEINYDKIAEARIAYGGKGTLSDIQQPRYGQQVYDIFFPF
ncbi:flagellar L-ring protein precursor FlgH [Dongia mobilis]|uniref:Flagellar L-ring protein n=1 Tax=Dongia mobilis TaxID=578943 RepID=A0A4V3DF18_9PROT|nr:flagellar basal body L-ring protein FlgH [Dongia mobilis]TDQ84381.1 flagellar L-ring protein precursor FlgH [Dongia mobilis]